MAASGHGMPMKEKVLIQSAPDVEFTCVIEHMVYNSDSNEARINVLGKGFSAKFGEFVNLKNPKF